MRTVYASIYADDDTELRVSGEYEPPIPGRSDSFGVSMPAFEGHLSVVGIAVNVFDEEIELSPAQLEKAREALWEAVNE